jgi:hypothetical protein
MNARNDEVTLAIRGEKREKFMSWTLGRSLTANRRPQTKGNKRDQHRNETCTEHPGGAKKKKNERRKERRAAPRGWRKAGTAGVVNVTTACAYTWM